MGKVISFAVKTLPFMDIPAYRSILTYAYIATERNPYTYGFRRYGYASLLFSSDPRHRFYRLHDFQLRYREHSFCGDVSCSRHCISGFGLFALEERKG